MKKDDQHIEIEPVKITEKPRRLSAHWTMETPLPKEELDKLRQDSLDAYDTWVWDTGTEEDKKKYKRLEKRLKRELTIADNQTAIDEIMDELAKNIRDTVDDDILGNLTKSIDIDDKT